MISTDFHLNFLDHKLACNWIGAVQSHPLVILHGAGKGTRERFLPFRNKLHSVGISSIALDFIGHGQTGGELSSSSLLKRSQQATLLIESSEIARPLRLLGSSMGAYNAIKIIETSDVATLVLFVPGIYSVESYEIPFGPEFSNVIRQERNWESSDAWDILAGFCGDLLIVAAGKDQIIPSEIPHRLYDAASNARSRELCWIKESPHLLVHYLNENGAEMEIVFQKIRLLLEKDVERQTQSRHM